MGKNRKWLQILILLAVVVIGGFTIGRSLFFDDQVPKEGHKAPSFALLGMDDKQHKLSDYKGKVAMINFWGTFCPPCKQEMPAIQKQYEQWKDKGLEVIGVNLGESSVTVQSFIRQNELTFPILYDPDLNIRAKYGVVQYPTTFFVNRDGEITTIKIGEMDERFIEQTLAGMLE